MPSDITQTHTERALLAAMMAHPRHVEAFVDLGGTYQHFSALTEAKIAKAVLSAFENGETVSPLSVANATGVSINLLSELDAMQVGEKHMPSKAYARDVIDGAKRRSLGNACHAALEDLSASKPADDVAEALAADIGYIQDSGSDHNQPDNKAAALDALEERLATGIKPGRPTGFLSLDRMIGGLEPARMFVVGARPGVGKTSFALSLALKMVFSDDPQSVAFWQAEMSTQQMVARAMQLLTGLVLEREPDPDDPTQDFEVYDHRVPDHRKRWTYWRRELEQAPLHIWGRGGVNPAALRTFTRRLKRKKGCDLLIVDYLQRMRPSRLVGNKAVEVAEVSGALKDMAIEFNIPVLALAQLNREIEKSGTGKGRRSAGLSDLKESGGIEQDADIIGFLDRPEMYREVDEHERGYGHLTLAKNRDGPLGRQWMRFVSSTTQFIPCGQPKPASQRGGAYG